MRDYQFGEWLASLRISNGYSQFQLGKLLGISDKAVSKWETGAAKPRTQTCTRLASIYGISLDDLMACRTKKEGCGLYSKQSESEERLWQEARDKLSQIYGENMPVAFRSRLDAEEILMRGSGMIRHLKLQGSLVNNGILNSSTYDKRATLTAWLMDAAFINPLQPHTVCPHCGKTTLHPEVKDGWDLPEERCSCGALLKRDGHDIRLDLCEKQFIDMKRSFTIDIGREDKDALFQMIVNQYDDAWALIEYQTPDEEGTMRRIFFENYRFYALIPKDLHLPFPVVQGVYQLPSEDYQWNMAHTPEVIVYINVDCGDTHPDRDRSEALPRLTAEGLLTPDMMETARRNLIDVGGLIVETGDDKTGIYTPEAYKDFHRSEGGVQYRFEDENISRYLPEKLVFSSLMQCMSLCDGWFWHGFVSCVVKHGLATIEDIPASQEDVFEKIRNRLLDSGIQDRGVALKALSCIQQGEITDEVLQTISALGFEKWFIPYLSFSGRYQLIHKEELVLKAYCLLEMIMYCRTCENEDTDSSERRDRIDLAKRLSDYGTVMAASFPGEYRREELEAMLE